MNKKLLIIICIFIVLFSISCVSKKNTAYEYETIDNKGIEIKLESFEESRSYLQDGQGPLSIRVSVVNHNPKPYVFKIEKAYIIRESNKAEYSAMDSASISYTLECDRAKTLYFGVTLPTKLANDKYYLEIKESRTTYRFYLHAEDYEVGKEITIKYSIDGEIVNEEKIKSGYVYDSLSGYITKDKTKFCNKWSINGRGIGEYSFVSSDVTLDGTLSDVFSTYSYSSVYVTISSINYVPEDGVLVFPEKINNKSINVSSISGSTANKIKEIYLPKNLYIPYSLSFQSWRSLEKIYYAGSQEDFNEMLSGKSFTINSGVTIIYNTPYDFEK